ncbi:amidohydrolase family protein [Palleronia sp. LCG004]|uniref:amidohydrolase family protein n=1 Tax=Palleronia sp. LCG004 TaxID=3079304 RepID=UPI002942026E|nr:amidohydrolase family protein [Palleronia sp. LCG004]WOI57078.1 amidohydrolase family protein [Palleronia sp. LCG004]
MDEDDTLPDATPDRDYDTMAELPAGMAPAERPKVPSTLPPRGACDTHVHMLGGRGDFRLWDGRPEDPPRDRGFDGWIDLLNTHLTTLEIDRVVLVHSVLYGTDNTVTIEALKRLGDRARGVGLIGDDATEAHLDRLADARIKAIRLNHVHPGVISWEGVKRFAPALAERDMHVEILVNAHEHLASMADDLRALPCPVVLDHLAWPILGGEGSPEGVETLERLVGDGDAYTKISGIYRFSDAPWDEADDLVARLARANPDRLLWGSDWPHILLGETPMPDAGQLLDAFFRAVEDSETRQKILVDTPEQLFGFR